MFMEEGEVMPMRGQLLGVGNTANVYEWGKSDVIKIFHDASMALHEAEKEARNAEAIERIEGVRAPKFKGVVEYEGNASLVYEKAEGPTMLSQITTESSMVYYARLLAELQYELHQVKLDVTPNLKREMESSIQRVRELNESEQEQLVLRLAELPEGAVLCHYDFHPGNIILAADGPIIIDWINALAGHPAADVARTYMLLAGGSQHFALIYADAYFERSGLRMEDIEAWIAPTLGVRVSEMREGEGRTAILAELRRRLGES